MMKETMTSKERVLKALNHEIPDRVPIDLGGFQTGIHKKAYAELLGYLGLEQEIATLDPVQQLARPSEEVLKRFRVDVRYVCAHGPDSFKGGIEQNVRAGRLWHDLKDEFGVVWSMPDDQQLYMDISNHPLADATVDQIAGYPFPDGSDATRFTGVRQEALRIRNQTPYAISTGIGGVVYETCWYMRGLERWFLDMIENPAFCEVMLDKMLKFWVDYYTGFMAEVGDIIDIVMIGDDLAGQHGPLFAPKFYRQIVKPRQKKLVRHIKSLTKAKIWYHTCGSCVEYIPDLIDNGVDILNPIQISAERMDPRELKERFGQEMVFWGGAIDTQHVLPFAGPDEVREHVRKNIEIFKPGGGYIFNNVHNIQAGVPPENIVALFDAAYEYGFYD
ncbi:MAG TPA: uroporphyrinogen decarboxylase family protein [Sedimentisphaerales bacterium]|nr:uroporphyrinogen decarboxylase family protein [Sedimentisphaerales bacterium]